MNNIVHFIQSLPWPIIAVVLSGKIIPYISARLSASNEYTGYITQALALVSALCGTYAQMGSNFNWKIAIAAYFATWGTARLQHRTSLADTKFEDNLLSASRRGVVTKGNRRRIDRGATNAELLIGVMALVLLAFIVVLVVRR